MRSITINRFNLDMTLLQKALSRIISILPILLFVQISFVFGQDPPKAPVPPAEFGELELVTGEDASSWASNMFEHWEDREWNPYLPLNVKQQCFTSRKGVGNLQSVIIYSSANETNLYDEPIDFVSYVCVAGEGAPFVEVNVSPHPLDGRESYYGWDGTKFTEGPAVSINGRYWYRKHIKYDPEAMYSNRWKYKDPSSNWFCFFAKTYLYEGDDYAPTFKLWAYKPKSSSPPPPPPPPVASEGGLTNLIGELISFRSYNFPMKFIRHQGFNVKLTDIDSESDKKDASFIVVPALNGQKGFVSFESVNYPGYYLRHQGFELKLGSQEDSRLYKDDASFKVGPGLAGVGYSFESTNYPGYYLRHSGFNLRLDEKEDSNLFNEDATFNVDMGLSITMDGYFHLKNKFRGDGECLEGNKIGGTAENGNAFMGQCQNVTGQMWRIVPTESGYYRLQTWFQGDGASLEGNSARSDYMNGAAFMDKKQNSTGQYWRFEPVGNGYYRLKTLFGGEGKCLEGNQAGSDLKGGAAFMNDCKNETGQLWKFEESSMTLECENSKTGAKFTLLSKEGRNIRLRLDWDEGATFSALALDITNGSCESCPKVGGIGRPYGTSAIYEIKQADLSKPVVLKWGGMPGNRQYCGEDRSLTIPTQNYGDTGSGNSTVYTIAFGRLYTDNGFISAAGNYYADGRYMATNLSEVSNRDQMFVSSTNSDRFSINWQLEKAGEYYKIKSVDRGIYLYAGSHIYQEGKASVWMNSGYANRNVPENHSSLLWKIEKGPNNLFIFNSVYHKNGYLVLDEWGNPQVRINNKGWNRSEFAVIKLDPGFNP